MAQLSGLSRLSQSPGKLQGFIYMLNGSLDIYYSGKL